MLWCTGETGRSRNVYLVLWLCTLASHLDIHYVDGHVKLRVAKFVVSGRAVLVMAGRCKSWRASGGPCVISLTRRLEFRSISNNTKLDFSTSVDEKRVARCH